MGKRVRLASAIRPTWRASRASSRGEQVAEVRSAVPLTADEATIGAAQQRVTDANTHMAAQMTILQTQIGNLDNVNPYQTATLVNSLTTQIQTAYSLTAALQKLSLVNYL